MDKMVYNKRNLWTGAIAGLLAGLVFGFVMIQTGAFDELSELMDNWNPFSMLLVNVICSAILGILFAMFFYRAAHDFFQCVFGGMIYGMIWWFVGHLTLLPLFFEYVISWDFQTMGDNFPMLIGYLIFGLTLGLIYYLGRRGQDLSHPAKLK